MAVVFDEPVHAVAIDHAGHKAILALEPRIPADELVEGVRHPHLGKRGAHDHAIPHPRPGVAARTGLDRRAVAVDEDVSGGGSQAVEGRLRAVRHLPFHRGESSPPSGESPDTAVRRGFAAAFEVRNRNRDFERFRACGKFPKHGRGSQSGSVRNFLRGWHDAL